jgi:hypothetical protein
VGCLLVARLSYVSAPFAQSTDEFRSVTDVASE